MVTEAMKLKDACSLEVTYDQPRQHIKKQRHYFASKGPSSQSYGFSSSHIWMWELDYKESWAPKESMLLNCGVGEDSWEREEKGMTEDEMVGWHHQLYGHEFEHAPGVGDGQGRLVCCSPWGRRVRHDWVPAQQFHMKCLLSYKKKDWTSNAQLSLTLNFPVMKSQ